MDPLSYCETVIKEKSASFYDSFRLLEKQKADAVFAIYAFCREADDAIDIDHDLNVLNQLKKNIKCTFEGDAPDDLLFQALKITFERFPSDIAPYLDLLEGMRDDYYQKPITRAADFEEHCYKAAGTVGLMLLPVIASDRLKTDQKALRHVAIELGKAMQITNILRDVREDFMKDRVYFPNEIFEQYNINIEILRTGLVTPEWRGLMLYYIDMARKKYQIFYDHLELFDRDAIYPVYLAARFYEAILDKIEKKDFTNLNQRHFTSKYHKWVLMRKAKKTLKKRGLML